MFTVVGFDVESLEAVPDTIAAADWARAARLTMDRRGERYQLVAVFDAGVQVVGTWQNFPEGRIEVPRDELLPDDHPFTVIGFDVFAEQALAIGIAAEHWVFAAKRLIVHGEEIGRPLHFIIVLDGLHAVIGTYQEITNALAAVEPRRARRIVV